MRPGNLDAFYRSPCRCSLFRIVRATACIGGSNVPASLMFSKAYTYMYTVPEVRRQSYQGSTVGMEFCTAAVRHRGAYAIVSATNTSHRYRFSDSTTERSGLDGELRLPPCKIHILNSKDTETYSNSYLDPLFTWYTLTANRTSEAGAFMQKRSGRRRPKL